jgi:hypothetical protein
MIRGARTARRELRAMISSDFAKWSRARAISGAQALGIFESAATTLGSLDEMPAASSASRGR